LPETQFGQPTLKRHNPKTVRKNTGQDYHGCLIIRVRQSAELNRQVEGWARASMLAQQGDQATTRPLAPDAQGEESNIDSAPGEGFEPSLTAPKAAVLPG
jgi:hypothetical protein